MLGRARREATAVAGGLRATVARAGTTGPGADGHRLCDCQAEGVCRHWRERCGQPPEDGRPRAEPEGRTAEGKRMTGGKRSEARRELAAGRPRGGAPCLWLAGLGAGQRNKAGESEGIAFPRRGSGAAPRLRFDPIRWRVWAVREARGWIGAKIRSQPERGSGQFRARIAQERRTGIGMGVGVNFV